MGRLIPAVASLLERKPRVIRLDEKTGDSEAAHELAVTTHRFSTRARAMVDDKLSLSAALMRAGEVAEAQRLLAEAEQELRSEEQDLMRQVEELETYRSLHKPRVIVIEKLSRASLARTLSVAMASCAVIAAATLGGAAVGLFDQNSPIRRVSVPSIDRIQGQAGRSIESASARRGVSVLINGVEVVLTRAEWRALKKAQRDGDPEALNDLLDEIAPELTVSMSGAVLELVGEAASTLEQAVAQTQQAAEESAGSEDKADDSSSTADDGSTGSGETTQDDTDGETASEAPAEDDGSGTPEDGGDGSVQSGLGTSLGNPMGDAGGDSIAG